MLGVSPYQTRGELLRAKVTGAERDIDPATQALFDRGHVAEAGARVLAEEIIGNELYPATVTAEVDGLPLLASCDGLTLLGDIAWEHKLWRDDLAAAVQAGSVPEAYRPQLEQQMLVTGATNALFMVSDGTDDRCAWCWYESDPELRQRLIAGWQQFAEDLAGYQHVETAQPAVATMPDALPALLLEITGDVRDTNLATYQQVVTERIRAINTDLQTDQDFADAAEMVKFLGDAEKEIEAAKSRALAQTQSIDELFRAVDSLKAEMRSKRLELNKLVEKRKESIRWEIIEDARRALEQHVIALIEGMDSRAKGPGVPADFRDAVIAAMKGKRTIQTLRDAAMQILADHKVALNESVTRAQGNLKHFDEAGGSEHARLFPDLGDLVYKHRDDFDAVVKARIAEAEAAQRARDEDERERIRAEEAARAEAGIHAPTERAEDDSTAAPPAPPTPVTTTQREPDEEPTLRLLDISARLGFTVSIALIEDLGIPPAERHGRAALYRESDFPRICDALIERIRSARDVALREAA
jgi:predicted phage-related endonuclease